MLDARLERLQELRLFLTTEHSCSYLPERMARNLVADPESTDHDLSSQLAELGFRRSGSYIYRPHCVGCNACLSLRIPTKTFQPNRSQQRTLKKNQDLHIRPVPPGFHQEHYRLFMRYLKARHHHGGMDNYTPESYRSIITSNWSRTLLYEFRLNQRLVAVAVVDRLENALSSVYTYFDPDEKARSIGTFVILWQILEARGLGLKWVYLGYWIRECRKMAYKAKFQPYEVFVGGRWIPSRFLVDSRKRHLGHHR